MGLWVHSGLVCQLIFKCKGASSLYGDMCFYYLNSIFNLNSGTIDLLCIKLLIRTIVEWDLLSKKNSKLTPVSHDCLETATK